MRRSHTQATAALLVAAFAASAQSAVVGPLIEAPVVDVQPIVELRTERIPVERCRTERVPVTRRWWDRSFTPAILGAVVGGTAGSVLGNNSSNRDLITGAGAVLGASVGNDIGRRRTREDVDFVVQDVCSTDYETREREQVGGYRVRYRYEGRIYETRTATDPGATIQVRMRLEPLA